MNRPNLMSSIKPCFCSLVRTFGIPYFVSLNINVNSKRILDEKFLPWTYVKAVEWPFLRGNVYSQHVYSDSLQIENSEIFQCDWSAWFPFFPSAVPKKSQGFEAPKFWHSISSDAELLDEDIEEEVEETTAHHEPFPFFEEEQTQVNETTQLGNDLTILHCRVQNLGEKTVSGGKFCFPYHRTWLLLTDNKSCCFHLCYKVSWVRRKGDQLHLLTFGDSLYSSDSRYSFKFKSPNDWQLHVQYANERDEGQFECQINTSPTLVFIVYLIVVGK